MTTNIFEYDGPLWRFLTRAWELLILNLLCVLFCLPVVTASSSLTALYHVTLQMAEGKEPRICRSFFRGLKENLRRSVRVELILAAAGGVLYLDARSLLLIRGKLPGLVFLLLGAALSAAVLSALMTLVYLFAVLARFAGGAGSALRIAFLMSVRHLPATLLLIAADILFFLALPLLPWLGLWLVSLPAAYHSLYFSRVVKKY